MNALNQFADASAYDQLDGEPIAQLRIPAQPSRLKLIRAFVRECASSRGAEPKVVEELVLSVDEACQNVIRHAYRSSDRGELVIDLRESDDRLEINIIDFAPPVDPDRIKPRNLDELRPGGLGMHFIEQCMDDWAFRPAPSGSGNRLWMCKRICGG